MQNRLVVFILFIMFLLQFSALKNPSMHPVPDPPDLYRGGLGGGAWFEIGSIPNPI